MRVSCDRSRCWERTKIVVTAALACALSMHAVSRAYAQRSSKERPVDAPVNELMPRTLWYPQVAFGADEYMVVWIDERLDATGYRLNQLLGARVTPDGRVLDPRGFPIAVAAGTRREPRVARSNDGFLVLWRETRGSSSEVSRFARVDADGHVFDPEGVMLPASGVQELSCAGSDCLTVSAPPADLRVLGFDVCGGTRADVTLAVPPQTSSQPSFNVTSAHVASGACGHFVAFGQRDQMSAETSIALTGFELDGRKRFGRVVQRLSPDASVPPSVDLASDGNGEVLLVWQQAGDKTVDAAAQPSSELWSRRFDQAGDASSDARRLMAGTNPALAFNGSAFVLVAGAEVLSAVMLNDDGSLRSPEPSIIRGDPQGLRGPARVAAGPAGALVVWDPRSTPIENELNVARLAADGRLLDPNGLAVAASANRQSGVQLARDGQGYLLLFHDDRPDRTGFLYKRLDAQDQRLADSAAVFDSPLDERAKPQLFRAGAEHALVWSEGQNQFLGWLDPDTHTARSRIALPVGAPNSRVTTQFVPGADSILALAQLPGRLCGEDEACDLTLSIQVLRPDATADDAMPATIFGRDGQWARNTPIASYDGHGFVVAFTQSQVEARPRDSGIRVLHVEPNGSVAAEPSIVVSTPDGSADEPLTIVTAGDGYLLVFARVDWLATPPGNPALLGLRLAADLSARDAEPFPITTASAARAHVSATYDGEAWLVVWQERAGESSWDIRAARVPLEPGAAAATFAIAASPLDELSPVLAAIDPQHALVAYERFDSDPNVMTGRVFLRDIISDASCAEPDCCDDECRTPAASSCKLVPNDPKACKTRSAPAGLARHGCSCRVGGKPGAPPRALAGLALLGLVRWRRRAGSRQRRLRLGGGA
jgi:MYXO-CTERM domain-containing protein